MAVTGPGPSQMGAEGRGGCRPPVPGASSSPSSAPRRAPVGLAEGQAPGPRTCFSWSRRRSSVTPSARMPRARHAACSSLTLRLSTPSSAISCRRKPTRHFSSGHQNFMVLTFVPLGTACLSAAHFPNVLCRVTEPPRQGLRFGLQGQARLMGEGAWGSTRWPGPPQGAQEPACPGGGGGVGHLRDLCTLPQPPRYSWGLRDGGGGRGQGRP